MDATANAPGFVTGFRVVGRLYMLGNALGILALLQRTWTWLFWVVIGVNASQAVGVVIPPEVFTATRDRFGTAGLIPSYATDGGAILLVITFAAFFICYRTPWAQHRT